MQDTIQTASRDPVNGSGSGNSDSEESPELNTYSINGPIGPSDTPKAKSKNDFAIKLLYGEPTGDLNLHDIELVRAELRIKQFYNNPAEVRTSWLVLALLLFTQINNQWSRYIIGSPFYFPSTNPKYSM